jgi:hypothetical protein
VRPCLSYLSGGHPCNGPSTCADPPDLDRLDPSPERLADQVVDPFIGAGAGSGPPGRTDRLDDLPELDDDQLVAALRRRGPRPPWWRRSEAEALYHASYRRQAHDTVVIDELLAAAEHREIVESRVIAARCGARGHPISHGTACNVGRRLAALGLLERRGGEKRPRQPHGHASRTCFGYRLGWTAARLTPYYRELGGAILAAEEGGLAAEEIERQARRGKLAARCLHAAVAIRRREERERLQREEAVASALPPRGTAATVGDCLASMAGFVEQRRSPRGGAAANSERPPHGPLTPAAAGSLNVLEVNSENDSEFTSSRSRAHVKAKPAKTVLPEHLPLYEAVVQDAELIGATRPSSHWWVIVNLAAATGADVGDLVGEYSRLAADARCRERERAIRPGKAPGWTVQVLRRSHGVGLEVA